MVRTDLNTSRKTPTLGFLRFSSASPVSLTQTGPVRHSVQCQVQEPRSGVGIQPGMSEAEPWVTGRVDASPGGAQERGANMTADPPFADTQGNDPWIRAPTEGSSYARSGLAHIGALTQGSASRLHPGRNSYAASRLEEPSLLTPAPYGTITVLPERHCRTVSSASFASASGKRCVTSAAKRCFQSLRSSRFSPACTCRGSKPHEPIT